MNYSAFPTMRDGALKTHYGRIISLTDNGLVTRSLVSGVRRYVIAADVEVARGGVPCELHDLKVGDRVRVTAKRDHDRLAIAIACVTGE